MVRISFTQIGVLLAGVWLLLVGAGAEVSDTLTLIFGIAIIVLVLLDGPLVAVRSRNVP